MSAWTAGCSPSQRPSETRARGLRCAQVISSRASGLMVPRAPAPGSPSSAARPAAERAETAGHRDGISRARHRAEPRRPRVLAEERHADHPTPARGRGVPTDDGDAMRSRGVPHARVEGVHVLRLGRGGECEGDQRPSRIAAHRGDVGEIDGQGLPADVVEGGRRSAEVHVLHDEVGRREQDGITRHVQHGGIVADPGPDPCSERAAGLAQPADQSELAELLDPTHRGHSSTARARPRRTSATAADSEGRSRPSCGAGWHHAPQDAGRSPGQTFASIFFLIWALGTAPMTWSTTSPLLMKRMVGMERMP